MTERPFLFDNVRIRATPETQRLGLAGLVGNVAGFTTPSVTGVEVIGTVTDDFALNVLFEERNEAFWFAPDLLEFIDHAPGTEIRLDDIPKKWVRSASGEWEETTLRPARTSLLRRIISLFGRRR